MAAIAVIVPVWTGHVNPLTTLGRELQRRGHEVTVISLPDAAPAVARSGLRFVGFGGRWFPPGDWARRAARLGTLSGLSAAYFTIGWMARLTEAILQDLPAVIAEGRFDGAIMDQTCFGAERVVAQAGLPLVVACSALPIQLEPDIPPHTTSWPWRLDFWGLLRNRVAHGVLLALARPYIRRAIRRTGAAVPTGDLNRYMNELPPSLVQIAQLPACLDFPRRHASDHFHHTGPWHEHGTVDGSGFPWQWLDGRPMIYASLGTLQNRLEGVFQGILDACADLPMQVVLALGRKDGPRPARVPSNALVVDYAPQLPVLARASLAITHAGLNTTLEAVSLGLPLVALPIANDQPGVAARIEYAGVGVFFPIGRLHPARLRSAVRHVLSEPRFRERARACAESIERARGLERAADLVEQAITERRRIVRSGLGVPA